MLIYAPVSRLNQGREGLTLATKCLASGLSPRNTDPNGSIARTFILFMCSAYGRQR